MRSAIHGGRIAGTAHATALGRDTMLSRRATPLAVWRRWEIAGVAEWDGSGRAPVGISPIPARNGPGILLVALPESTAGPM